MASGITTVKYRCRGVEGTLDVFEYNIPRYFDIVEGIYFDSKFNPPNLDHIEVYLGRWTKIVITADDYLRANMLGFGTRIPIFQKELDPPEDGITTDGFPCSSLPFTEFRVRIYSKGIEPPTLLIHGRFVVESKRVLQCDTVLHHRASSYIFAKGNLVEQPNDEKTIHLLCQGQSVETVTKTYTLRHGYEYTDFYVAGCSPGQVKRARLLFGPNVAVDGQVWKSSDRARVSFFYDSSLTKERSLYVGVNLVFTAVTLEITYTEIPHNEEVTCDVIAREDTGNDPLFFLYGSQKCVMTFENGTEKVNPVAP